jgi:hypothetical protein
MTSPKLHLILVNDNSLHAGTIDVLQEHFTPDLGVNCGFLESFDSKSDNKKLKDATKDCFALLRETKMWAFVDEVVELGFRTKHNHDGNNIFSNLKKILLDVEFNVDTTLLIHGSLADTSLALSILTDTKLNNTYQIELSNYSATKSNNNVAPFVKIDTPTKKQKVAV